ncbi:MAG: hypothetical protein FD138_2728, partial [Planctomycetota bacterium]
MLRLGSQRLGPDDNGATLTVSAADRGGSGPDVTSDASGNLTLILDSNSANPTTAQKLIDYAALNVNAQQLLTVSLVSGNATTSLAAIAGGTLALSGAGAASALSAFGTSGASGVNVLFTSNQPGLGGNNISLQVNRLNLSAVSTTPRINVVGQRIEIILNDNAGALTTAQDLITAINTNAAASRLVKASLATGSGTTSLANVVDGSLIRLSGSDRVLTASAVSGFQTNTDLRVQFAARQQAIDGNEISLVFNKNASAVSAVPTISVSGKQIVVTLSSNAANPTTANDLITALIGNAAANTLISTKLVSGVATTNLSTITAGTV